MRAYSMDLRERALLDSDAGMKAADVAAKYRVSGSCQLGHRRFLAQRLQRDLRLQLGRVTPSLLWHARLLLLGLDPTLASCPNFGVHL